MVRRSGAAARFHTARQALGLFLGITVALPAAPLDFVQLPPGFAVSVWAKNITGARSMTRAPDGTVFVGSREAGKVYALRDKNGDGRAEWKKTLDRGRNMPNGVAFKDGDLYVAEIHQIIKYPGVLTALDGGRRIKATVVKAGLPNNTHHGWKYLRFGPDGKLYFPVGAPCNVCDPALPYAAIHRIDPDGGSLETLARGVRNTVGFDWHPTSGELWFTDNGRDHLGDDVPPCELNRLEHPGQHFGFPFRHGANLSDPQFGGKAGPRKFTPPAQELGAHVAPLGMRFYTGKSFPKEYQGQIFLAEHGSWNRSSPVGYQVSLVRLEGDRAVSYEPFATGWLRRGQKLGRPVDLLMLPDGSLLVSDDHKGRIYRIRYEGE